MRSFPWDSIVDENGNPATDPTTGYPIYDRPFSGEDFRFWFQKFFSDGYFANDPNGFKVTATNSGMTVSVAPGAAFIKGTAAIEDNARTISFDAADKTYARIDTVVLRWNAALDVRSIDLYVRKGTPSSRPTRPNLQRQEGQIWELGICDVNIPANTAAISSARITDTRLDSARCGMVTPYAEFDTTTFYNIMMDASKSVEDKASELLVELMNFKNSAENTIDGKANQFIEEANKATEEMKAKANETLNKANSDISEMKSELQSQTDKAVELSKAALDGTMATHLQNQIDGINDYTTGINLLRGTRDFRTASTLYNGTGTNGFGNNNESKITRTKENGYTVVNYNNTSGASFAVALRQRFKCPLKAGDTLTVSFMYRKNAEYSRLENVIQVTQYDSNNSSLNANAKSFGLNANATGLWYQVVGKYTLTEDMNDDTRYLQFDIRCNSDSDANYSIMQPMVQVGDVNNPIWSPSPFDIDYINDDTTGINLIRGSRDFVKGSNSVPTSSPYYLDGFNTFEYVLSKDSDGFTMATMTGPVSGDKYLYSTAIEVKTGEQYTVSFYAKLSNPSTYSDSNAIAQVRVTMLNSTGNLLGHAVTSTTEPNGLKVSELEPDTWYEFKYSLTVPTTSGTAYLVVLPYLIANKQTSISFKKICVYKGIINNPIWSPSPFDTLQVADSISNNTIQGLIDGSADLSTEDDHLSGRGLAKLINWIKGSIKRKSLGIQSGIEGRTLTLNPQSSNVENVIGSITYDGFVKTPSVNMTLEIEDANQLKYFEYIYILTSVVDADHAAYTVLAKGKGTNSSTLGVGIKIHWSAIGD